MSNILNQMRQLSPVKKELYKLLLARYGVDISQLPIKRYEGERAPLSYIQQSLLFISQLMPDSAAYNVEHAIRMQGKLNVSIWETTLRNLVERHEILRTAYRVENSNSCQFVVSENPFSLQVIDLSQNDLEKAHQEALGNAKADAIAPFDLTRGEVLRAKLFKLAQDDYLFVMTIHHIAIDGFSEGVIADQLAKIYASLLENKPVDLPEVQVAYADYAAWERARLDNNLLDRQIAYWTRHLEHTPPLFELSSDRPRSQAVTFNGYTRDFKIPKALYQKLRELSRSMGNTLFMTILSAYQLMLYRYSRQQEFVVATAISNRSRPELENLVGCMANVIVIKANFIHNMRFQDFVKVVASDALDAFSNQELPFEVLVEKIHPKRDLSYNPIFQVSFELHQESFLDNLKLADVTVSEERLQKLTAKYDFGLSMVAGDEQLIGGVEFNSDLFDVETIDSMIDAFQNILCEITQQPEARISELLTLSTEEKRVVFEQWSQSEILIRETFKPLHRLFTQQVQSNPDKIVAYCNQKTVTYKLLDTQANQLANYLLEQGLDKNGLVAVCVDRSLSMLVAVLAVLKAGGCYLPVDPNFPRDRVSYMLKDSGAKFVLTESSLDDELSFDDSLTSIIIDKLKSELENCSCDSPGIEVKANDLAYIIYTSGSTGKPKGVMVPHGAVTNFLRSMALQPGFKSDDRLLAVTTLSFDIAVLELYLPLISGGSLVLADKDQVADGDALSEIIEQNQVSVMQATPATWRLMLNAGWQGQPGLKVLCGGEALPQDLAKSLLPKVGELWNMYGPTETTVWSTCYRVEDADQPILIGKPIANTQCYILDENKLPVPAGVFGELHIGGNGVTAGYHERQSLTNEKFITSPFNQDSILYRTGDLARFTRSGDIEYSQRVDNQVKVRGFRIELGEIETVIAKLPQIKQAAVKVVEERAGDQRLIAYYVADSGAQITTTSLRKALRQELPDYMLPHHFMELDQMPLTPNGKIDRQALASPFSQRQDDEPKTKPRNHNELALAEIWADVLGISSEEVSVFDNFFDIGGHSLLSMQVVSRIYRLTGQRLNPRVLLLSSLEHIATQCSFESAEQGRQSFNTAEENESASWISMLLNKIIKK